MDVSLRACEATTADTVVLEDTAPHLRASDNNDGQSWESDNGDTGTPRSQGGKLILVEGPLRF